MMMGDEWDWRFRTSPRPDARTIFKTFLRMNAKSDGPISAASQKLEPLFKISGAEFYPWTPAAKVIKAAVAEAVRRLTGRTPLRVEVVPVRALAFSGASLLLENFQERLVSEANRGSLFYTEEELLRFRFAASEFEWGFMEIVRKHFLESLWNPLSAVLGNSTDTITRASGIVLKWSALRMMVYHYICCAILADKESREDLIRYEMALHLLGNGIILWGEERGSTGVWFVLAG